MLVPIFRKRSLQIQISQKTSADSGPLVTWPRPLQGFFFGYAPAKRNLNLPLVNSSTTRRCENPLAVIG